MSNYEAIFNLQIGLPLQIHVESTFQLTELHFVVCLVKHMKSFLF